MVMPILMAITSSILRFYKIVLILFLGACNVLVRLDTGVGHSVLCLL